MKVSNIIIITAFAGIIGNTSGREMNGRGRGGRGGRGGDGGGGGRGNGDTRNPSSNGRARKLGAQPDTANTPISSPTNYSWNNKNVIPGPKPLN